MIAIYSLSLHLQQRYVMYIGNFGMLYGLGGLMIIIKYDIEMTLYSIWQTKWIQWQFIFTHAFAKAQRILVVGFWYMILFHFRFKMMHGICISDNMVASYLLLLLIIIYMCKFTGKNAVLDVTIKHKRELLQWPVSIRKYVMQVAKPQVFIVSSDSLALPTTSTLQVQS